jgi:hypothetical protein
LWFSLSERVHIFYCERKHLVRAVVVAKRPEYVVMVSHTDKSDRSEWYFVMESNAVQAHVLNISKSLLRMARYAAALMASVPQTRKVWTNLKWQKSGKRKPRSGRHWSETIKVPDDSLLECYSGLLCWDLEGPASSPEGETLKSLEARWHYEYLSIIINNFLEELQIWKQQCSIHIHIAMKRTRWPQNGKHWWNLDGKALFHN